MGQKDHPRDELEHTKKYEIHELLNTKLNPLRLHPLFVRRGALLARLDEGADHKLTLISAPAGFGKTTLVSEWITFRNEQRNLPPIAWVSSDPPIPLARLRARNELNEIRAEDLRFSMNEIQAFLEQTLPFTLSPEVVARLTSRTEGWIAGLQMAALSLHQREAADVAQFIEDFSGSHRYIMDYRVVYAKQSAPVHIVGFITTGS